VLSWASAAHTTAYTFTTLDVPGAVYPWARGINNVGQIVGYYAAGGLERGFLLTGGTHTTIAFPGATPCWANGINDAGQILGYFGNSSGHYGFLLSGGSYTTLDLLGAGSNR
jgi:uncharacterized membrane protein